MVFKWNRTSIIKLSIYSALMKNVSNRAVIRIEHFYNQPNKQMSYPNVGLSYLLKRFSEVRFVHAHAVTAGSSVFFLPAV